MKVSQWQRAGSWFSYENQYQIFFRESGKGEPLVLLHGFPTSSWDWHKIWEGLAGRYHLLAPDFIGFGFSDKPRNYPYSIMDQANLIEQFCRAQGLQNAHLLAHDYGDSVAQELLARMLDRQRQRMPGLEWESVVLLNGGVFPESHHPRPVQKALIGPLGFLIAPFLGRSALARNFKAIFGPETQASEEELDQFWSLIKYNKGKRVFHRLIRYMSERREHRDRWVNALVNCPVPLKMINGFADPISGQHLAERFAQMVPQAQLVGLEDIGHYPQTEAPKIVLEEYFEFRDGLQP